MRPSRCSPGNHSSTVRAPGREGSIWSRVHIKISRSASITSVASVSVNFADNGRERESGTGRSTNAQAVSARIQHWPGIDSSANRVVDSIVKMRRSIARIACISNVSDDVTGIDNISGLETAVPIEMRVIVRLSSRAEDVDGLSAETVRSDASDNAFRGAQDRTAALGKDVYAFV